MTYCKFEKIQGGENPIIRVTYKTWWGKKIVKDVCKCSTVEGFWVFMDSGDLTHNFDPLNNFHKSEVNFYLVNEQP